MVIQNGMLNLSSDVLYSFLVKMLDGKFKFGNLGVGCENK